MHPVLGEVVHELGVVRHVGEVGEDLLARASDDVRNRDGIHRPADYSGRVAQHPHRGPAALAADRLAALRRIRAQDAGEATAAADIA